MIQAGDTIGPYILVRTLGRGAFGEVWLAERRSSLLTTHVALKLPLDANADIEVMRQEARIWLRASGHTNIVPVMDAEVYDGQVTIASEYVADGSLTDWLGRHEGKAPSVEIAARIMSGILAGLQHLHENDLIYRDLKPDNVLLQGSTPRLTDFGLTRVLKPGGHTSNLSGTPAYMAPEAFRGQFSPASDIWSAGMLLHELLVGASSYSETDFYSLMVAITSDQPATLSDQIPDALRPFLTKALAKMSTERFASASEMAEALTTSLAVASANVSTLPPPQRTNLPNQTTSFIGRATEIAEVTAWFTRTSLLTLTGSGGCGKTRLALQVGAAVLEDYTDGVWLVELASLTNPDLVPQTAADVLGIREMPNQTITKTLTESLKAKHLLLVLDNCEHVLDSAARLVDSILRLCPRVRFLVTSREALGISGENAYRIPSLSIPDVNLPQTPDSLARYDSVSLFVERAVSANADFRVTDHNAHALASVCGRLDGIPLALELAAARVRAMPLELIDSRLDDRFRLLTGGSRTALPRQQTLRALIDWSYSLLSEPEKTLVCRLGVFAGGWTLEAAESVCAGEGIESIAEWEMLDLLTSLVDKSLVSYEEREGQARYRVLETVRQYALDRLAESDDVEATRTRHQAFFLAMAEEIEPQLTGPQQTAWMDKLEREHDNLRAALEWSNPESALRIAGALWRFWSVRSYLSEGLEWLTRVLAAAGSRAYPSIRAKVLRGTGSMMVGLGNFAAAQTRFEECFVLCQELGDKRGIAAALNNLGRVARPQGDLPLARKLFEDCVVIYQELGDKRGIANALCNLGMVDHHQGDYPTARRLMEESLAMLREVGDQAGIAIALINLVEVAHDQGDYATARTLVEEGLALHRELGDKPGTAWSLQAFAALASVQERSQRALRLWGAAEMFFAEAGILLPQFDLLRNDRQIMRARTVLGEEAFAVAWAEGRALTMEQAIAYALEEAAD